MDKLLPYSFLRPAPPQSIMAVFLDEGVSWINVNKLQKFWTFILGVGSE